MKNQLKVSKSGKTFFFQGEQRGNLELPKFLEKFGTIDTDCESVEEFITKELPQYAEKYSILVAERKIRNDELEKEYEIRRRAENEQLLTLIASGPIPATIENIRLLLLSLNEKNWGGWILPAMTIGYSAAQHNCDGTTATTIKLAAPIAISDDSEEMETKFVVGAPHGYLNSYRSVR